MLILSASVERFSVWWIRNFFFLPINSFFHIHVVCLASNQGVTQPIEGLVQMITMLVSLVPIDPGEYKKHHENFGFLPEVTFFNKNVWQKAGQNTNSSIVLIFKDLFLPCSFVIVSHVFWDHTACFFCWNIYIFFWKSCLIFLS